MTGPHILCDLGIPSPNGLVCESPVLAGQKGLKRLKVGTSVGSPPESLPRDSR